ncbi:MAG: hypothetical protein HY928_14810 [Elusimicrobia bacterium]|nr:hypothetical protein [Elusimicrobiota bacterium]
MTRFWTAVLFFASGACALGYEVVWAKTLTLTLGGSAAAQAAVLATFLGGLSAGGFLLGPAADAAKRPLLLFAALELGVAACGFLAPWVLAYRSGLGLVTLAAALMGGTLPALSRARHAGGGIEVTVARLYAVNNAGAAAGALLTGTVLIASRGLMGASHALAGLGVLIALGAALLDKGAGPAPTAPPAPAADKEDPVPVWLVLTAVFLSGIVTLSYEAGWVRLLAVVLGASAYSFTAMLTGFVAGMGIGSAVVSQSPLPGIPKARLYGLAQLGAGLAVLASWPLYERLPWLFYRLSAVVPKTDAGYIQFEAVKLGFCFLLTFLPTAFLGAAFPLASRTAAAGFGMVGAGVGAVGALAALGNVVGALTAGIYLLPRLGVQGLLTLGAGLNLLLGAAVVMADSSWAKKKRIAAAAIAGLVFGWHILAGGSWDRLLMAVGTHRFEGIEALSFKDYLEALRLRRSVLFQKDDAEASVSVMEMPEDGLRALMINGKADASNGVDMGTQVLLGSLPFVLNPDAKSALVVGLGSGVTAGTSLRHPIERLDAVEISPAVVQATRYFEAWNGKPFDDERLHLHVGDGRAYLRTTKRTWDAIVSEPSNPWIAGVGNLFTVEYFKLAKSRLNPGGVMVQWFHTYENEDASVKSVLASFSAAFDDASVWRTNGGDAFVVGFNGKREPDFAAMEAGLEGEPGRILRHGGLAGLAPLLGLQLAGDEEVRLLSTGARLNTDRRPYLEYAAPRGRFLRTSSQAIDDAESPREALLLSRYLAWRKAPLSDEEFTSLLTYHKGRRDGWRLQLAEDWRKLRPSSEAARIWLARIRLEKGDAAGAASLLSGLKSLDALVLVADALRDLGSLDGSRRAAAGAAARMTGSKAADMWLKAALWAMDDGKGGEAADFLGRALGADPEHEKAKDLYEHLMKSYEGR